MLGGHAAEERPGMMPWQGLLSPWRPVNRGQTA